MDTGEYDRQLNMLGLHGPMGELRLEDGSFVLVYKMPDGTHNHLPPPSSMTGAQRAALIAALRLRLGMEG